ncbi:hypothetical protein JYU34_018469 [Plutella xylostella]|uniref:Uncharacterized protein n=1 Tax=Plutella xylostella TaxID=51655 RepID=A0ABQ7PXP1_PLUXY|nr:hypothetical protein JYU34_018451 [Plutella xylostella]KAG7297749.1 hypothetical protein JYU34_018469 [Plutella xylostella]
MSDRARGVAAATLAVMTTRHEGVNQEVAHQRVVAVLAAAEAEVVQASVVCGNENAGYRRRENA